jgi:transcriptional regulator with XRE-family HTH domain
MIHTVADLCREQSIDVAELAKRSGLDEGRVTAIALGRWTPSPAERQKIAAVFGVAPDQIAWGHSTPIQHLYGHGPG